MTSEVFAPVMASGSGWIERRDPEQSPNRQSGTVISITGSRAVVSSRVTPRMVVDELFWSVGNLISIYGHRSRIICLVQDMRVVNEAWQVDGDNIIHANVELLGEVVDDERGLPVFRRGISHYPPLGSLAHRIRRDDLIAIFDLGGRKGSSVGQLTQDTAIDGAIDIDGMLRKHFAVVGTTGVGKSCAVSILLRAAVSERKPLRVIIVDPHNEYTHAFRDVAHTVESRSLELPFWLFRFEEFLEVVYRGTRAPEEEVDFLRDAIVQAKEMYDSRGPSPMQQGSILKKTLRSDGSAYTADAPQPYRINDILALIDEATGRLEVKFSRASLRALRARLESLSNDPSYRFMFGKAAIDGLYEPIIRTLFRLSEANRPITILQMAGIPADVVNASVSVIARIAFELATQSRGLYEILLLCEEAHRYVPSDSTLGFAPTRRALARIAKEGRKYGCYLGIVTQRPSELDPTILSQCSSVFAMRLSNAADQEIIRAAIPDAATGVLDFLSALSNREVIAFGEAVSTPMRMLFHFTDQSKLPKMSDDPDAMRGFLGDPQLDTAPPVAPPPVPVPPLAAEASVPPRPAMPAPPPSAPLQPLRPPQPGITPPGMTPQRTAAPPMQQMPQGGGYAAPVQRPPMAPGLPQQGFAQRPAPPPPAPQPRPAPTFGTVSTTSWPSSDDPLRR